MPTAIPPRPPSSRNSPRFSPSHTHQNRRLPMTRITSSLTIATLLVLCLHVATAQAQLVRTCVSMAKGDNANAASFCHCTTPCRTFATAHNNTLPDGEITVLDPGDYGGLV